MDVFKIHVGEGRAIAISRENYFMETKGMRMWSNGMGIGRSTRSVPNVTIQSN